MDKRSKNYWRPLWSGLIMDSEYRHIRRMGTSLPLFLYLILKANDKTGFLTKSYGAISRETGIKPKTVRNWMANLKNQGYISTKRQGNNLVIQVKKWKTFSHPGPAWSAQNRADGLPKPGQSGNKEAGEILYSREKMKGIGLSNRYIDYINNVSRYKRNEFNNLFLTKEELLARDLAEGLDDAGNLGFYLSAARKYPEGLLRKIYSQVKEIPLSRIKRSRGAVFNYLIKEHVKNNPCN